MEQETEEGEDALVALTQAVHNLREQCSDVKRMLPGENECKRWL